MEGKRKRIYSLLPPPIGQRFAQQQGMNAPAAPTSKLQGHPLGQELLGPLGTLALTTLGGGGGGGGGQELNKSLQGVECSKEIEQDILGGVRKGNLMKKRQIRI